MCTCTSCEYTDKYAKSGFAEWPRGEPAGKAHHDRAYAAHVRHVWAGAYKTVQFTTGQAPRYPAWTTSKALGDGGEHRKYPSAWGDDREKTTAEYLAEFIQKNGYLTEEELAKRAEYAAMVKREEMATRRRQKPVPPLLALARELRKAA